VLKEQVPEVKEVVAV